MASTPKKFLSGAILGDISTSITPTTIDNSTNIATTSFVQSNFSIFIGTPNITTVGTITSGTWSASTISIIKGGSGQVTANASLNAFLPTQVGNATKFLQTDGTNTSWVLSGGSTGLTPSIQVGTSYTAISGDYVVINSATHTVTLPTAVLGRQVGVIMFNATVTSVLVKTSVAGQNINGIDRSSTGFGILTQYETYIFEAISATDWVIQTTSRVSKVISVGGTQDGTNKIFALGNIPVGFTLHFYENGQLLSVTNDYTLSGASLTYVGARNAPLTTDNLIAYAVPVQ